MKGLKPFTVEVSRVMKRTVMTQVVAEDFATAQSEAMKKASGLDFSNGVESGPFFIAGEAVQVTKKP